VILIKKMVIVIIAFALIISLDDPLQALATPDAAVNVDTTIADGISGLSLGVTHTHLKWEQGNPTAVNSAKNLLIPAVNYQNQHIMGFGADNPQPTEGGPTHFTSLDARIQLMKSIGGDMVITFCTAPGWMKTSGQDWNMADRVIDDDYHIKAFADLAAAIADRYKEVMYFQIWNEFKGYWDDTITNSDGTLGNFDYVRYMKMYNAVYTAVKEKRPDAKVGGFYLPVGGDGSNILGYSGEGTYTPLGSRDMDSLQYWLTHKVGADFICVDFGLIDWFNTNHLNAADGLKLTWTYKKIIQDIQAKTNLPIWFSEYYALPNPVYNGGPWVAAAMASIYYNMIKGEGTTPITALLWNPEEGEPDCPHYLFTSTTPAAGGQPTPHYYVFKGMHDYFSSGTQLYKATSSDPNIEVLASAYKTMLINKYNTAKLVSVNGVEYTLTAYEVRFVDTPPVKVDASVPSKDVVLNKIYTSSGVTDTTGTVVALGRQYSLHSKIVATTFWVGEIFDSNAPDGSQVFSTYDSEWMTHYGGCDGVVVDQRCQTERRTAANDFFPTSMIPKMNPFYLDLPFDDLHDDIAFKQRAKVIPWANDPGYAGRADDRSFSYMKGRWVKLMHNSHTCYGQNEDAGPGQYHDSRYVFGSEDARPANKKFNGAGMDISPALNGCLGFSEINGENDKVDWQFVDDVDVPLGPWKTFVTTEKITVLLNSIHQTPNQMELYKHLVSLFQTQKPGITFRFRKWGQDRL
jgi:hypothetical protein